MSQRIERYVTLDQAAKESGLSQSVLKSNINSGKLVAVMLPTGSLLIRERDLMSDLPKDKRPEYVRHAHLRGVEITLREASRKYGVPGPTISRWVHRGLIAIIRREANYLFIDESDMAYCAEIYETNQGRGKWIFKPDGTPYIAK